MPDTLAALMSTNTESRPRILTGDTPTGRLHLGHYVGSLERRLAFQETHDCYFLVADIHAMTTRAAQTEQIYADTIEVVRDWLAVGIDPERSTIFVQSEIPAIAELTFIFAMLLGFGRVMRNPTIKDEIVVKNLGDNYSFGFLLYAVGQTADILVFRPEAVPVGEDQVAHIEMTREVARRFNQLYCGVSDQTPDEEHVAAGGLFPIPAADVGRIGRLVGTDGTNKMSKSLDNAIYLSDSAKQVQKKVNKIFTGRQSPTDPGDVNNVLFQYLDAFLSDRNLLIDLRDRYAGGKVGDGDVKKVLGEGINGILDPIRARRAEYEGDDERIRAIIRDGCTKANNVAEETLDRAKQAMHLHFGSRNLSYR